ncbi:caspase, EACC1-associated type [Streptomyces sp. NPDC054833]
MAVLPEPTASQALLIGVHTYEHLIDLPAVEANLTTLAETLTDPSVWGLPPSHCTILSQPRSVQDVLDPLIHSARQASDTLVVYYAGHGLTDPNTDELYLALPGTDGERMFTALPYDWVRRAVLDRLVTARRKVVILDCCFSGQALVGGMSGTEQMADHARIAGTYLLTASAETRKALAPPGERFTAFTGELITVLAEGIAGGPALLDMDTVYRHLHRQLAAKSRPLPQQRNRNAGGQVALARNRAFTVVDSPLKSPRGVSYARLAQLLTEGEWAEADSETAHRILEVCGTEALDFEDVKALPYEDLKIIDDLWVAHSNGRFGFSVQARLWLKLGPPPPAPFSPNGEVDSDAYDKYMKRIENFADLIGWRNEGEWRYDDGAVGLVWDLSAPVGHLPGALVPVELNINKEGDKAAGGMWFAGLFFNIFFERVLSYGLVRPEPPAGEYIPGLAGLDGP